MVLSKDVLFRVFVFLLFWVIYSPIKAQKYGFERVDSVIVSENGVQLSFPWVGGINSAQFSTIDLNNDGLEDLFVFDRTGNKVLTFLNMGGSSGYQHAPEYENLFPELQSWALLRDYNCDGKKDIFSYVSGGIGVWENTSSNGNLSFVMASNSGTTSYVISNQYGNYVNLYVSRSDIPDINDIDGDGDLDVLTFGVVGSRVEFHKNLSIENGYGCDSLYYELKNACWGHFLETGFGTNTTILYDTCSNISNPEYTDTVLSLKHAGSTLLSLDLNGDNVKDLILGDVSFNNLVALTNDNTGANMNTSFVSQDTTFPSSTVSVDLQIFPGSFYEDVDNDSINDLIVSPNSDNETENAQSVLFYKNYGTNSLPVFSHIKDDFMQDEMIEKGRSAFPVLFDYNNDGLTDLFVANFGFFDMSQADNYRSQIALYKNIGTTSFPEFQLVTDDFQSLSTLGLGKGVYPTFADLDNDGDIDMICGTHDGFVHYFINTTGSLGGMNMVLMSPQLQDDMGAAIDVGYAAKPFLFDIDNDLDYDLIIGEENGNLNYYENVGTQTNFIFRLRSETFGNIDISLWWTTIGNSIPYLMRNTNGSTQLIIGSERGSLFHYNNIDNNILGTFNEVDTIVANINIGPNSSPTLGDLNGDNIPDMLVGVERGGVSLYMGNPNFISSITSLEPQDRTRIFPNPTENVLHLSSQGKYVSFRIFNNLGQLVKQGGYSELIDVRDLEQGIYLLLLKSVGSIESIRFIKD